MSKRGFALAGSWLCWALLAGCGYRLVPTGGRLPEGIRSVHAPVFSNATSEPGLEVLFTQAFREQLLRAGVDGGPDSEARVDGQVLSITGGPTIVSPAGKLASYRLTASALVRLTKQGRVVSEAVVGGTEDFLPGADPLLSESNRGAALRRLADVLMRQAYERLAAGW